MPIEEKQSPATWQSPDLGPRLAGFMTYLLLIFLPALFLFLFVGYASAQENMLTLPIDSSQFSGYYSKDDRSFEFYLRPEYEKLAIRLDSQEASVPRQGLDYGSQIIEPDIRYYEIGCFFIDDYLYKLVIFKSNEDDSIRTMSIQLNSYNSEDIMLDALVLDTRWAYEGTEAFQKFKIRQGMISIDYYETNFYDVPPGKEMGSIYLVENPVPHIFSKAQYRIDNGRFIMISKEYKIDSQH